MAEIVEDLKENDHFNFILFETVVIKWKHALVKATPENLMEAKEFIGKLQATGGNYN